MNPNESASGDWVKITISHTLARDPLKPPGCDVTLGSKQLTREKAAR